MPHTPQPSSAVPPLEPGSLPYFIPKPRHSCIWLKQGQFKVLGQEPWIHKSQCISWGSRVVHMCPHTHRAPYAPFPMSGAPNLELDAPALEKRVWISLLPHPAPAFPVMLPSGKKQQVVPRAGMRSSTFAQPQSEGRDAMAPFIPAVKGQQSSRTWAGRYRPCEAVSSQGVMSLL